MTAASPPAACRNRLPLLLATAVALAWALYVFRPVADDPVAASPASAPVIPSPSTILPPAPIPAPPPPPPQAPERGSIPGLSVNATFATSGGGGSVTVTRPDGSRAQVATGSDAVPGTRLTGVAIDRAFFTTGGRAIWLPLQSADAAKADPTPALAAAAAPPPPPPESVTSDLGESLAYQAALASSQNGPWKGYAVRATTPPLFAKAGLKPGDLITGINGRAFETPQDIALLSREAKLSQTVVFQVRRNGRTQEMRVDP